MFTTCPKCSLKLVVTAADLRVAQGYVRCGRCSNVFNALAGLSDEQQAVLAREPTQAHLEPPASSESNARAPTAPQSPAASPPSGRTPAPPRAEETIPDEALEFDLSSTDVSEVFVEPLDDDPTGTFESIVLRTEELQDGSWSETEDEARGASDSPRTGPDPQDGGALGESIETHELEIDLEALVAITAPLPSAEVAQQQAPAPSEPPPRDRPPPRAATREPVSLAPAPPSAASRAPEMHAELLADALDPLESERTAHEEEVSGDG